MIPGLPLLLSGSLVTVEISVLSGLLALAAAAMAGLARQSSRRALRWPAILYIELFRGTALLIQLFWMYYVLPDFGVNLPAFAVAVLAVGLNYGAYGAEVVRGAMQAVGRGQREAARALGLSPAQVVRLVVLPQAAAIAVLPWGNLMVQLVKATSLVSLITIAELSYRAYQLNQVMMRTAGIFGTVLVLYFVITQAVAAATRWADAGIGRWRRVAV
jgi:polar amino acid transport system permease protein